MVEFDYPIKFNVTQIGHLARDVIRNGGRARVGAVFENSLYIETPAYWVCIIGPCAAMGPLVLRCDLPPRTDWRRSGVRLGTAAYLGETTIYVNPFFHFSFSEACTWVPSAVMNWTPKSLQRGLKYLAWWTQKNYQTDEGLGCTIPFISKEMSTVAMRAIEPIKHLRYWLTTVILKQHNATEIPSCTIDKLIGLGPGLTPSGDDFLGGAIIALRLVGCQSEAKQLFNAIVDEQVNTSNAISISHLSAAAKGSCNASTHAALNAILDGDIKALPLTLKNIDHIGHTSGWDSLAGAATVLTLWSELKQRPSIGPTDSL